MRRLQFVAGILALAAGAAFAFSVVSTGSYPLASEASAGSEASASASADTTLVITYVANEGVLISSGDKQVLIDGLHREYKPAYAFLPDAERSLIETASAPFDSIDLVLVSHLHLDHFHPEAVSLHLQHNGGATLVSSQQVVDEIKTGFSDYSSISGRVVVSTPPLRQRMRMKIHDIDFEVLGLGHVNERFDWIQNLGHIVYLGGKKLLHVGDAPATADTYEAFNLDEERIDIAFLPAWYLMDEESVAIVREFINPRHIVAVHISPADAARTVEVIGEHLPDADAFTRMMEKRHF